MFRVVASDRNSRLTAKGKSKHGGRARSSVALAFLCLLAAGLATKPAISQDDPSQVRNADVIDGIAKCATSGQETVLFETEFMCAPYNAGAPKLQTDSPAMPLQINAQKICDGKKNDKRVLPGHAIKTIVLDPAKKIETMGIRINGAIFCEPLDLIGLNLPYSLVIDHSIFVQGIEARNFQTSGDFSFDGGLIFGQLGVKRAHIGGTIFGSNALIQDTQILDSDVHGSLLLRGSVLLQPAVFDTVTVSGELSLRQAAFPYFLLQFSKVGGVLDLTGSQARCAYQLKKDTIGDLVAVDVGLGRSSRQASNQEALFDWDKARFPTLSTIFAAAEINKELPAQSSQISVNDALTSLNCDYGLIASPSVFVVADTDVKERLCMQSFYWLSTADDKQESDVTLNDITVGASAFIDLTQNTVVKNPGIRQFEMLGFQAHSLIFNFGTASRPPSFTLSYLNGLQFEQVYSAGRKQTLNSTANGGAVNGAVTCGYDPSFASPSRNIGLDSIDNLSAPLPAPRVEEVTSLLNSNAVHTTQPFAAFVTVFQKNGDDNSAKALQIIKADTELRSNAERLFGVSAADASTAASGATVFSSIWSAITGFMKFITDLVAVFFGYVLWLLADSGYRPEKVGWFVVLILALSFIYFWVFVGVIAIRPQNKSKLLPVGLTFLFDRLLPAYQIREDHYKIDAYLKRVAKGRKHDEDFRYLGKAFRVIKADEKTALRVERALDILKFLGLVLAVFLVAALNALVNH